MEKKEGVNCSEQCASKNFGDLVAEFKKTGKIDVICKSARVLRYRRGESAVCLKDMPEDQLLIFFNFPDKLTSAPNCIATKTYSSGHSMPDSYIEVEEMEGCPYRGGSDGRKKNCADCDCDRRRR